MNREDSPEWQNKYGIKAPWRIDEARFMEMLGVLPPSRWSSLCGVESFHVCERLSGEVVSWFGCIHPALGLPKEYWEMQDLSMLSKNEVSDKFWRATPTPRMA